MQRTTPSESSTMGLDYLRLSPVRGQLEPYDPTTTKSWRYIQVTDTLDELKVLLPPGTAAMYEQLLKLESYELEKKTRLSWERILEIRHLKERMLRKCQKIAKSSPPIPSATKGPRFQSHFAPSDFRLKEMEKWFREQHKRANGLVRRPSAPGTTRSTTEKHTDICCPRCTALGKMAHSHPRPSIPSAKYPIQRSITGPEASTASRQQREAVLVQVSKSIAGTEIKSKTKSSVLVESQVSKQQLDTASAVQPVDRATIASPPPLPVFIRGQREAFGLDDDDTQDTNNEPELQVIRNSQDQAQSPSSETDSDTLSVSPTPSPPAPDDYPAAENGKDGVAIRGTLESSLTRTVSNRARPALARRRSCIKRASIGDIAKTVSWADDQEWDQQLARVTAVTRSAQDSESKWAEVRTLYTEQLAGLDALQAQVAQGLENLQLEVTHLQRINETVCRHRDAISTAFHEFEQSQEVFQGKIQEALDTAREVLPRIAAATKRELRAIDEV